MTEISLRAGRPEDDAVCGRIIAAASRASSFHAKVPALHHVLDRDHPIGAEGRQRLIAEKDGKTIGFADYSPDGHVRFLFVDPAYQGQGGAGRLLAEALDRCGHLSVHCPVLNSESVAWYKRRGLRVTRQWTDRDWHGVELEWLRLEMP